LESHLKKLEALEEQAAETLRRFARVYPGAAMMEVAGGVALYSGPGSPINVVKGMKRLPDAKELAAVEAFFASFGLDCTLELSPGLEPEGYEKVAEEDVMFRPVAATGVGAETVEDPEGLAKFLCEVFGADLGDAFLRIEDLTAFAVRHGGLYMASGQLIGFGDIALLAGDATGEAWRGKGLQRQLIEARVQRAYERRLRWATAEVQPNSTSQRNYMRCGFVVLYTRTHWTKRVAHI
jgi:GNAT superfamily N-acetyltransferase